jgi:hypothetical protein
MDAAVVFLREEREYDVSITDANAETGPNTYVYTRTHVHAFTHLGGDHPPDFSVRINPAPIAAGSEAVGYESRWLGAGAGNEA